MAVAGTAVSKASDVVVLDQSFNSISKVRKWGEWLKESRGQFIDLYIPTSLTIVFLTFISSLASSTSEPALSLVQILCITLLINPLAVLALSTDKPWLGKANPPISSPLPSIYYLVAKTLIVLLLFIFGHKFPGHSSTENMANVSDRTRTLIFNTMAFMQISRTLMCWKANRAANWIFPIILICGLYYYDFGRMFLDADKSGLGVAIHLSIVLKGGSTFHIMPMNGVEWGLSMALSALAVPLAFM
jgi:Ca2+-transporting ATPase